MLLKQQLVRLLRSWQFGVALLLGLIIIWGQALTINHINAEHWVQNAFLHLTGFDNTGIGSPIYFIVLPLLSSLASGSLLQEDKINRFKNLNLIRIKPVKYLTTILTSSFLIGGLAGILPLVLEASYFFFKYPVKILPYTRDTEIIDKSGWSFNLFMHHPFIFWLMFILIIFIFSGIFSQISIVSSYYSIHRGLETIIPFIIVILSIILGGLTNLNIELNVLIAPNYSNESSSSLFYIIAYILVFEIIIWYLTWGNSNEDNFS